MYRRYEQEWKAIANSTSVHDFASFRSRFPDSPFDHKAYDKIDSLDWVSAKKSGTENALQNYLDLHPDGKYADLAQDAKQAIIDSKPSTEEQTIISNNIMRYFVAITDNSKEALSPITTAMGYDKGCESIDAHANTGIYNYIIASPINIVKTPQSAENKYNATFMVQCISTNIEGISIRKEYTVKTTLNSDMLINAVNMRATAQ